VGEIMTLGKRIVQLRKERKMTQEELANILKITRKAVSKWEVGRGRPNLGALQKLADFFGCSVDYLLGRTDVRETPGQKVKTAVEDNPELLESHLMK
jgi:transcriptional regulator with XRE-family HTH domain